MQGLPAVGATSSKDGWRTSVAIFAVLLLEIAQGRRERFMREFLSKTPIMIPYLLYIHVDAKTMYIPRVPEGHPF